MNTNNVKKYAPKARKAFIEAMSKQAAKYGITKKKVEPTEQKGDLVLIGDRPFPASVIKPRERLVKRIEQQGFDRVLEHVAYSWFNRLCAIRYMERKGFLDHGRRVLSAADGSAGVPQILEECLDVELPGLDQTKVRELKLDGTKDEELYRELLLAQCHVLHQAMPFLFEALADESELLLPENLTKTDSLIREFVTSVPDEDWNHIEIIGWLYQFYISEKKDQVMGKVVKSEDIPAATQLFTPNWIVQYLVQNSVGRQWLQTYPNSPLKEKMPYYIEPAEQTPEVQAQLAAMTPKDLKPEALSCIDPAVGSGHLLIEAYKVFKSIYEERGYRTRDIPQLILENNLFGLDIDDRAGQLAGFALMMLAREDDRRIFSRNIRLNVLSLQESSNINLLSIWRSLNLTGEWQSGTSQGLFEEEQQELSASAADNRYQLLQRTLERFKQAKIFGSLINVPHEDYENLKELFATLCELEGAGDSMQKATATQLIPYVHQAVLLAHKYDAVVANPPYMGSKGMNADLKEFAKKEYPISKSDLFAVFMQRGFSLLNEAGFNAQVNMQSWMFLSTYSKYRSELLRAKEIDSILQIGFNSFPSMNTKIVLACAFSMRNLKVDGYYGKYIDLNSAGKSECKNLLFMNRDPDDDFIVDQNTFLSIPDTPIAYWFDFGLLFSGSKLSESFESGGRVKTHGDDRYVRYHWELDQASVGQKRKWRFFEKGGDYRRWYGNRLHVINWSEDARAIYESHGGLTKEKYWGRVAITWSDIALLNGFRLKGDDSEYSSVSPTIFPKENEECIDNAVGLLNTNAISWLLKLINPGIHANPGDILKLPYPGLDFSKSARRAVSLSKHDWDMFEISSEFKVSPLLYRSDAKIHESFLSYIESANAAVDELKEIEQRNNVLVIEHFGIHGEINAEVPIEEVSLTQNSHYRYSQLLEQKEFNSRFRSDCTVDFASFSIGVLGTFRPEVTLIAVALTS
ncbi:BREX-1 system adenine-specific DNA-methyltransferase PglX [Zhongshania sp. BJYM1]|uniref:BREX-1 system adenine-specific DNA-methyltransferase PglX n=1 Tax=Zhongshania aquatica TaxID=2965069 RepID=UPI0022B2AE73|nr:BREX-1 system adenine-specific DNA-methyltransferase PglX [Marortus sp. BJYM1]